MNPTTKSSQNLCPILTAVDMAAKVFFGIIRIVVKAAPLGAFGAMAFTVGSQGWVR